MDKKPFAFSLLSWLRYIKAIRNKDEGDLSIYSIPSPLLSFVYFFLNPQAPTEAWINMSGWTQKMALSVGPNTEARALGGKHDWRVGKMDLSLKQNHPMHYSESRPLPSSPLPTFLLYTVYLVLTSMDMRWAISKCPTRPVPITQTSKLDFGILDAACLVPDTFHDGVSNRLHGCSWYRGRKWGLLLPSGFFVPAEKFQEKCLWILKLASRDSQ